MKKKNKKSLTKTQGFTLIEILATLIVISLVFGISGYYVTNILSTSKEKTQDIAFKSIQKSANMYVQEYEEEIVWNKENNGNSTACISIDDLIDTGYLKENQVENLENMSYMIITKKNNSIIKEENDTNGKCGNVKKKIAVPTSKICTNPEYNTKIQTIVETNQTGYTLENTTGTNAGEYKVTAKLAPNYIWKDNTTENKIITCTIKKAIPIISFSQNGQDTPKVGEKTPFTVTTNIPGKITAKSSDLNHIKPTIENPEITETGTIKIECLSSKELPTYITVTLTPNDTNNYFTVSKSYTVGKVERKETDKPTTNYCIPSLLYNGSNRTITKAPGIGYTFLNNKGTDAGDYKVIAQLKYGYIWTDGTTTDATITCSIEQAPTTITINSVEGDLKNDSNVFSGNTTRGTIMREHEITLNFTSSVPGDIEITPTSNNFINISTPEKINDKTYKVKIKAKSVTDTSIIVTIKNSPKDSNNYEQTEKKYIIEKIIDNEFKIDYNCNGGGSGPARQTVKYNTQYTITSSTCTRQGYTQNQWLDPINNKWTAGKTGTWKLVNGNNGIQDNTLTLKAVWQANQQQVITYSINYNLNNGTSGAKAPTSAKANEVVQIDNPTKTVTITGNANGTGVKVGNATKITQTFNGWTATGLGTSAKRGDKSNNVNTTWNGSNETKSIYFINLRSSSGTATLTAKWQPTQASVPTFAEVPSGKICSWNTKADGTGTTYDTKDKYNLASDSEKDITLYAICISNINITLEKNGGTGGTNSLEIELNKTKLKPSTITLPTKQITVSYNMNGTGISQVSESKINQSLNGWYSAQTNGEQIINNSTTPQLQASTTYTNSKKEWTNNTATTLYAHWNSATINLAGISNLTGHTCKWAEGSTNGTQYSGNTSRSLTKDTTYYAVCTKNTYTITYIQNTNTIDAQTSGATISTSSQSGLYNSTVTLATITKAEHTCNWNTQADGKGNSYASGANYTLTSNITLYGRCISTPTNPTYNITLNKNGGTGGTNSLKAQLNTSTLTPSTITLPTKSVTITYNMNGTGITQKNATVVNQTLNGWYTTASGGSKVLNNSTTPQLQTNVSGYTNANKAWIKNANTTLYAHWNASSTTLATITKTNNICSWNTKADGSGTSYSSGKTNFTVSGNITLYAKCILMHWQVGNNKYTNLASAINAASANNTITALNNHTDTSTVSINKNVTIDTNGKTITRTRAITVNASKTVTFTGTGKFQTETTSTFTMLIVNGTANIDTLTFQQKGTGKVVSVGSNGIVNMTSGKLYCGNNCESYTVDFNSTKSSSITGGDNTEIVNKNKSTIRKINTGNLTLNCNVYSKGNAVSVNDTNARGRLTIAGGVITNYGDSNTIHMENGSTTSLTIDGGIIWRRGAGNESTVTIGKKNGTTINEGTIVNDNGIGINIIPGASVTINKANIITLSDSTGHSALHGKGDTTSVTFKKGYLCTNRPDGIIVSKITGVSGSTAYRANGYEFSNVKYFYNGTEIKTETINPKVCLRKT